MNERIPELAKEYGLVRWDHDSLSYELRGDIDDLLEFTKLIVRECAKVAFDDWCEGTKEASSQMAILKHFGVEE